MLKFCGFMIKLALFSVIILVLANWIEWRGKTVSDQIKIQMAHAERTDIVTKVRNWTKNLTEDAKKGAVIKFQYEKEKLEKLSNEAIPSSEKEKLRSLIQDLNTYPQKN